MFLWLPQVGFGRYTTAPGMNLAMNAAPTRRDPVPESDCTVATRLSAIAADPSPRRSLRVASLNSASPCMGRYSLSKSASIMRFSACLTTSRT